jgi:hypothetical protein
MRAMSETDTNSAAPPVVILVNGEVQVEYDRSKPLPEAQRGYLDRMDDQMGAGITLGGERVPRPDVLQRAQFVAVQVLEALGNGNDALVAAGCAWLATRLPDLTQVRARLVEGGFSAELVFGEPYAKEVAVQFTPRRLS